MNILYSRYSNRLYNYIFRYLKTEEDTLDIIQEIFIKVWLNRKTLSSDSNIDAYLFTIAKNSVISTFRKKLNQEEYLAYLRSVAICSNSLATEQQLNYNILAKEVEMIVSMLPKQRQQIYRMNKEQGFSNKKIANTLEISIKTVEDHMTKASKFVRENLKNYGSMILLFF